MNIIKSYLIMKPIQLPWAHVSPAHAKGLDYHLSPELFIRLEGIISGDYELNIANICIGLEDYKEVSELEAEDLFTHEFMPGKSKERITRAFKEEGNTCFFLTKQMIYLQDLFEKKNFMASQVTIYYKDKKVENAIMLPPIEYKLVCEAFLELDVIRRTGDSYAEEERKKYNYYLEKNTAKLEDESKKTLWEKVQNKQIAKQIGKSILCVAAGVAGVIGRHKLAMRGGIFSTALALVVGTVGVIVEIYGRQESETTIWQLRAEKRTRGGFSF